jgi:AcrR family transcriptional regulator
MRSPRRTQSQRRDESKARILTAAIELLIEKGFDRFSLQDVGKRANCSHELVNFYFGSKDGLLDAMATHIIANFSDGLLALDVSPNAFERLAKQIMYISTIADRDLATFTAYLRIAGEAPFSEHLSQLYRTRREHTLQIFRQTITAGKATGHIRRGVDPDAIAQVCYDFVRGHVDRRLLDRDAETKGSFNAIISTFIELLRGQIAIRKRDVDPGIFTSAADAPDKATAISAGYEVS